MFNVYLLVLDTIGCQEKYDLSSERHHCALMAINTALLLGS